MLRSLSPALLPGVCKENVDAAVKIIQSYSYAGPVVLACDDTKLEPVLREFAMGSGAWVVIGNAGEPLHVRNEEELDEILEDSSIALAEKVCSCLSCHSPPDRLQLRLWILTIPVPKIPPIILAGVARGSTDDADDLFDQHARLVALLVEAGIVPVAYASDGTEVERKLQRRIVSSTATKDISVGNSRTDLAFTIPVAIFDHRPMIMIQDSKHSVKTARNQLFTGARLLAMGNCPMFYNLIRDLAGHDDSPLFLRDVENLDRQDDRAAARLFSAEALEHHCAHYPDRSAVSLYLFFLGGLLDAWQSRKLGHLERVRLVQRCKFFLRAWQAHIDAHPTIPAIGTSYRANPWTSSLLFATVLSL